MASFDYDVVIIGSGFGGSLAALRAAEKGYRVGVMESGRRWPDEDVPKTRWDLPHFSWFPAAELYGIQRIEYLDDVLMLSGAGVGGGSHVYANTLSVPPKRRKPKVWYGLPFGAAVWASGYVVLPQVGIYKPIWKYDLETLAKDLSAHLVFGTATAAAFALLARKESP